MIFGSSWGNVPVSAAAKLRSVGEMKAQREGDKWLDDALRQAECTAADTEVEQVTDAHLADELATVFGRASPQRREQFAAELKALARWCSREGCSVLPIRPATAAAWITTQFARDRDLAKARLRADAIKFAAEVDLYVGAALIWCESWDGGGGGKVVVPFALKRDDADEQPLAANPSN